MDMGKMGTGINDISKYSGSDTFLRRKKASTKETDVIKDEVAVRGKSFSDEINGQEIKKKWLAVKQFFNTDEPLKKVGITEKKNIFHFRRQLACRCFNSLGSVENGFITRGRFLTFSPFNRWLSNLFGQIGMSGVKNMLQMGTDEVEGGAKFLVKIMNESGNLVAKRRGKADDEGYFNLEVKLTNKEKKKVRGKELRYEVFFRGVEDEKEDYAYFNKHKDSKTPVGGGNIHLVKSGDTVISSDIDKTIMDTTVGAGYFYQEPWERKYMPGAVPFYQAVDDRLHTISGSTDLLSVNLMASFENKNITPKSVDFKDWLAKQEEEGLLAGVGRLTEQIGFKLIKQLETSTHLPNDVKTIAHGDITEYDPIFYLLFHGISSGDITSGQLDKMFSDKKQWPELAKVPDADKKRIKDLSKSLPRSRGLKSICINIGSGNPQKPRLTNAHKITLENFLTFAERLENLSPGNGLYKESIIFTDNYLQTALFYHQNGYYNISEKVIAEAGKDVLAMGFSPEQITSQLREVVIKDDKPNPRAFLKPETIKKFLPLLKKHGIIEGDI